MLRGTEVLLGVAGPWGGEESRHFRLLGGGGVDGDGSGREACLLLGLDCLEVEDTSRDGNRSLSFLAGFFEGCGKRGFVVLSFTSWCKNALAVPLPSGSACGGRPT